MMLSCTSAVECVNTAPERDDKVNYIVWNAKHSSRIWRRSGSYPACVQLSLAKWGRVRGEGEGDQSAKGENKKTASAVSHFTSIVRPIFEWIR